MYRKHILNKGSVHHLDVKGIDALKYQAGKLHTMMKNKIFMKLHKPTFLTLILMCRNISRNGWEHLRMDMAMFSRN